MLERKHKGILSLNPKRLANPIDDLKIILILQNEMLILMLICKRVVLQFSAQIAYLKILHLSSNSYLKSSHASHACQIKLLKEEILKKSRIKTLEKDFNNRKEELRDIRFC